MAETIGSLVDKICIAELKIFHMQEQIDRVDATPDHKQKCSERLQIMNVQRDDLALELTDLVQRWSRGEWMPKIYRQFKMYNDPTYKITTEASRGR